MHLALDLPSLLVLLDAPVIEDAGPIRAVEIKLDILDDLLLGNVLEELLPEGNTSGAEPVAPAINLVLGLGAVRR